MKECCFWTFQTQTSSKSSSTHNHADLIRGQHTVTRLNSHYNLFCTVTYVSWAEGVLADWISAWAKGLLFLELIAGTLTILTFVLVYHFAVHRRHLVIAKGTLLTTISFGVESNNLQRAGLNELSWRMQVALYRNKLTLIGSNFFYFEPLQKKKSSSK